MKHKEIDQLLIKYWNAETTLQEEALIKAHFNESDLDDNTAEVAPWFKLIKEEQAIKAPALDYSMMQHQTSEARVMKISTRWRSAAALLLVALAAMFVINSSLKDSTMQGKAIYVEVDNPEEALEYTKMALAMLSKNYQKGSAELTTQMGSVNKMNIIK
jgi:hypothetical protein